jgi:hypothetical protein
VWGNQQTQILMLISSLLTGVCVPNKCYGQKTLKKVSIIKTQICIGFSYTFLGSFFEAGIYEFGSA